LTQTIHIVSIRMTSSSTSSRFREHGALFKRPSLSPTVLIHQTSTTSLLFPNRFTRREGAAAYGSEYGCDSRIIPKADF
jgi:hypothetical protein